MPYNEGLYEQDHLDYGAGFSGAGHGFSSGYGTQYAGPSAGFMGARWDPSQPPREETPYARSVRFGIVDNALLIVPTMLGMDLDGAIASIVPGARGYGALIGALVGNALSDGIAGWTESPAAGIGAFVGAMIPLAPVAVALLARQPLEGGTRLLVAGASIGLVMWTMRIRNRQRARFREREAQHQAWRAQQGMAPQQPLYAQGQVPVK